MISMNLLPPAERRPVIPLKRVFGAVSLAGIMVCITLYAFGFYHEYKTEQQVIEERNRYELLSPTRAKIRTVEEQQKLLASKNKIILTLTKERRSWHTVLAHLGAIAPQALWLTEIKGDMKQLTLQGKAVTYQDLSVYMQNLAAHQVFDEPVLLRSEPDGSTGVTRFEFTVKLKEI